MSYIGFKRDRCYLAYYKSDFKHKFFPILINGNMFVINVDEKIIFCLEEEDKFSEKLCLTVWLVFTKKEFYVLQQDFTRLGS
jgi:hypothetical protein